MVESRSLNGPLQVKNTKKFDLDTRRRLVLLRTCKLFVHETCHLMGLAHCIHYQCCMNGSGHLKEDFAQPIFLCPVCLRKLGMLSTIDFEQRYRELKAFFSQFGMAEEERWLNKRLEACQTQN